MVIRQALLCVPNEIHIIRDCQGRSATYWNVEAQPVVTLQVQAQTVKVQLHREACLAHECLQLW